MSKDNNKKNSWQELLKKKDIMSVRHIQTG